jgi:5-methylcytosine-specific restriction protein B
MTFDGRVLDQLRQKLQELHSEGAIPSAERLEGYFATFRDRFGPDRLRSVDGAALLQLMHGRSDDHASMMYWLEFKNDDEFPAIFGGIGGGSAFKFGIFQRKETGEWVTGSAQKQVVVNTSAAIEYVRGQRDQLLECVKLISALPNDASLDDYLQLQANIDRAAPNIAHLGWTHKYLSLLFPTRIDDIHSEEYQRFHLHRVLVSTPSREGRYVCTWHYVQLMRALSISMFETSACLNRRNGSPFRYWRIGASDGTDSRNRWELMQKGGFIAVGWDKLGDLSSLRSGASGQDQLKSMIEAAYEKGGTALGKSASQLWKFLAKMGERDLVAVMDGATVLSIASITGDYFHVPNEPFPHRRPVKWLSSEEWRMQDPKGLRQSVATLDQYPSAILEIESKLLDAPATIQPPLPPYAVKPPPLGALTGVPARIETILERKGQVILYGPPGTGKTHWADWTARELAARQAFQRPYISLSPSEKEQIDGAGNQAGLVRFSCFHPAYGYEDFIEGYKPKDRAGQMQFTIRPGIFRRLCEDAARDPSRIYYLIIDEINRGDIPRIFGELLLLLEKNKRGLRVQLPLSGDAFSVPPNVRVIGTMNTADRSIALLDTALRRRFGFVELMPQYEILRGTVVEGVPLFHWLRELNQRICRYVGQDARHLQIGHSYLMESGEPIKSFAKLARIVQDDILPLLEEYCYDDFEVLRNILQAGLIDAERRQVRHELFELERKDDLIQALLAFCPDISTSVEAVEADKPAADEPDDEDDET